MNLLLKFFQLSLIVILTILSNSSFGQLTPRQERNLDAFANLYGYVRFFHPSDEANNINLARFAESGSLKMLAVKDDDGLIKTLKELFLPIAPTIKVYPTNQPETFIISSLTPPDTGLYNKIYWQNLGISSSYSKDKNFISERVNRLDKSTEKSSFSYPISDTLDLSRFAGKRLTVTFLARTSLTKWGYQKLKVGAWHDNLYNTKDVFYLSSEGGNLIGPTQRKITFSGIIDKNHPYITWKISGAGFLAMSIDSVALFIDDENKNVHVPFKGSPYTIIHPPAPVAIYDLRINNTGEASNLYPSSHKIGDVIKKEIVPDISVIVPTCLYGNQDHTFPKVAAQDITRLESDMYNTVHKDKDGNVIDSGDELDIRMANVIMSWVVINNSYPYWSRASKTPLEVLNYGFNKAFTDKTNLDFLNSLKEMYKPLNDGLFQVFLNDSHLAYNNFFTPVSLGEINGKIIVSTISDSTISSKISAGDVVIAIDHQPATALLKRTGQLLSGSVQWKTWRALQSLMARPENSIIHLTISHNGKNEDVSLKCDQFGMFNGQLFVSRNDRPSKWASPGIYYLNLANDDIPDQIKELKSAKAVIIDLRNDNLTQDTSLFSYFAKTNGNVRLLSNPEIDYPDHQSMRYKPMDIYLRAQSPFTTQHLYFITDASTTGILEDLALYVRKYKLGKIIGSKTSGTYTGANTFHVLGDYQLSFSGLKLIPYRNFKAEDGIMPDVIVNTPIADRPIETAIAIAKKATK